MAESHYRTPDSDHSSANTSDVESGTGGSRSTGDDSGDVQERLIKNEEKAVRRAKLFVGTSVFLCVVAIVLAVYFLTTSSDTRSFELAVSCLLRRWSENNRELSGEHVRKPILTSGVPPQYDAMVKDIQALVVWEVRYNFALMEQLR